MSDYINTSKQMVNLGLNLRDAPDKLQEGQWTRLTNIRSESEGSITSRPGRAELVIPTLVTTDDGSPVCNTLFKLNNVIISGSAQHMYRNGVPYPTLWAIGPKSWVKHRTGKTSEKWAYLADYTNLRIVDSGGRDIKWGITAPVKEATFGAATSTGPLDSSVANAIVYDYRYTYMNSLTNAESNGSPIKPGVAIVGKNGAVNVWGSGDPQVDRIGIYRRGGTVDASASFLNWRRVGVVHNPGNNQGVLFIDVNADSAIALATPLALDNDVPFTSKDQNGDTLREAPVPYIFGPAQPGGIIFGCGDPNRPGFVYWTNPGRPHSASSSNSVEITSPDEPLLGGFMYNGVPYVWSKENLFALDFLGFDSLPAFLPRKTPCGRGISSPFAFAVGPEVWFLSKDGIYSTDGQSPAQPITETTIRPLFDPDLGDNAYTAPGELKAIDWNPLSSPNQIYSMNPASVFNPNLSTNLRMAYGSQYLRIHYRYRSDAGLVQAAHLVLHIPYNRWSNDLQNQESLGTNTAESISYFDEEQPNSAWLIGMEDGRVVLESGTTDFGFPIQCRARTGSDSFGMPQTLKEFGNVIVDVDPGDAQIPSVYGGGSGVALFPYYNAETSTGSMLTLSGVGRQKIPNTLSDTYAYSLALDFEWNGNATIYQADVLWHPDEEWLTHWEFPPTTFGKRGWIVLRDMYLTLRSTGNVNVLWEVDGVNYLPAIGSSSAGVIPSTGGSKTKFHLYMPPVKGKLFRPILNGGPFRLYGEDCEVRVKEFLTGLGYELVAPFAQAQGGS